MPHETPRPATQIGWIGTGVMGGHMCRHLLRAGYPVTVFSRTQSKAQALIAEGAAWADSPADVARCSRVVFSMVGFPQDVREITLGPHGTLSTASPGTILVEMTTSQPSLAVEIALQARHRGLDSVDAPVSGGDVGAAEARLSIMVGGEEAAVAAVHPLLQLLGSTIVHQGGPGAGQHAKMVNQILIAGNMVGLCEALLYAHRAGLDVERVLQSVTTGAAASWSLSQLAPRIERGDFAPGFYVEHFLKDLGIALAESRQMRLALPGLALAEQLYRAVEAQGYGRSGTQALALALAQLSGATWPVGPA